MKTLIGLILPMILVLCPSSIGQRPEPKKDSAIVNFVDVTTAAGIKWGTPSLAPGIRYLIETMGGGGGFIDYNNDGLLDLYLICYSQMPLTTNPATKMKDALFRNNGDGTFTDVTDKAGISNSSYGMGMAVGDYNNDGWSDFYVTGYHASKLYRNNGNGTFTDVTQQASVGNTEWGTSAAFFDYDNDGYLDLFVCNYLDFDPNDKAPCDFFEGRPFCYLNKFKGSSPKLYHNNHDGTFLDVSTKAGIGSFKSRGLGVVAFDYNNDQRMDIFEANDAGANFLFQNNGDGTFSEVALAAGVAYDQNGKYRGAMGVDAEDLDGDGYQDLFVTNFSQETNAFWHNNRDGTFDEITYELDLARISIPMSGFGTRFFDYNNDGLSDLFVLNGHPFEPINKVFHETTYAEPPLLFENTGKTFRECAASHGVALQKSYLGRGLATGDFDNDGDMDLLLINAGQSPALLRNDGGNSNNWLGIKLVGSKSNRDGIGAIVSIKAGDLHQSKQLLGGTSYCSASDHRLLFGLGKNKQVEEVKVKWPSGSTSTLTDVNSNRYLTIKEGG